MSCLNWTCLLSEPEPVGNCAPEGAQFVKGFGGIGGILRYKVDFMEHEWDDEEDDSDDAY